MSRIWIGAVIAIFGAACGSDEMAHAAPAAASATAVEVAPAKPPVYVERAGYDFRLARLLPEELGTTKLCDVGYVRAGTDGGLPTVTCGTSDRHQYATIELDAPAEALAGIHERTQIEVRIDAALETGADVRATLVRITGEERPPEPPPRCLCRDHDHGREDKEEPPAGFDFKRFEAEREQLWGTRQTCRVGFVGRVERVSAEAREYSIGRAFDPEQLGYAVEVTCMSEGGSRRVVVGATSPHSLLRIRRDTAIEIELGWSRVYGPHGRMMRVSYEPSR
jgi:hypothetical protein